MEHEIIVMRPNLHCTFRWSIFLLVGCVLLVACAPPSARAAQFNSYAEAVAGSYFFPQRVIWVGDQPPSESESRQLFQILDGWRASHRQAGLADIEMFLEAYTNSAWAPCLHSNLAKFYRDRGRYTLALGHWEQAWVMSGQYPDGAGKIVADFTLAHWTRLLAGL